MVCNMMNEQELLSRIATAADKDVVWSIISRQQELMRQQGRNQWQQGYPNPAVIAADVQQEIGRVLVLDGTVVGYCALIYSGEPCYDSIEGRWLTTSDSADCRYSVVHRIGIDPDFANRGLASRFLQLLMEESRDDVCESMRIDTNNDNVQMLHILPKLGFTRCGNVVLPDGPRIAFEHLL